MIETIVIILNHISALAAPVLKAKSVLSAGQWLRKDLPLLLSADVWRVGEDPRVLLENPPKSGTLVAGSAVLTSFAPVMLDRLAVNAPHERPYFGSLMPDGRRYPNVVEGPVGLSAGPTRMRDFIHGPLRGKVLAQAPGRRVPHLDSGLALAFLFPTSVQGFVVLKGQSKPPWTRPIPVLVDQHDLPELDGRVVDFQAMFLAPTESDVRSAMPELTEEQVRRIAYDRSLPLVALDATRDRCFVRAGDHRTLHAAFEASWQVSLPDWGTHAAVPTLVQSALREACSAVGQTMEGKCLMVANPENWHATFFGDGYHVLTDRTGTRMKYVQYARIGNGSSSRELRDLFDRTALAFMEATQAHRERPDMDSVSSPEMVSPSEVSLLSSEAASRVSPEIRLAVDWLRSGRGLGGPR